MQRRKINRLTSLLCVAAMTGSLLPVLPAAAEEASADREVLASFNFDDAETGFESANAKAVAKGTYALQDSKDAASKKALYLDGNAGNYLALQDKDGGSLLNGKKEITISYDAKPDRTGGNWVYYAAPNEDAQKYPNEHYLGALQSNGNLTVERYNNNGSRPATNKAATGSDWAHVDVVYNEGSTTLYVDGEKKQTVDSDYTLPDILGDSSIFYIGRANWGSGEGYKGWIDNFTVYGEALTDEELKTPEMDTDTFLETVKEQLTLDADLDAVKDNLDLPSKMTVKKSEKTAEITWKSSDTSVITDQADGKKEAGLVTRPEKDTVVTLTATITCDGKSAEKTFQVTVKAKSTKSEKTSAYLFAYFTGTEGKATDEQIYFSLSKDGSKWQDLTDNGSPVLTSDLGDKGVRDPYLVRSPKGDKFYLIATDLSIYHRGGWGKAQATTKGSTKLIIWESDNLVDWSEPRSVDVAGKIPGAGCAWAPEAFYDEDTGNYVVYWATASDESNKVGDRMNMYYATTRDFRTFSDPVLWIDREHSIIDTTMIKVGDTYYRASGDGQITIEKSKSIYDGWEIIGTLKDIFNNDKYSGSKLEGPEFFKYNEDDYLTDDSGNKVVTYGLMCDQYAEGKGYLPFRTTDIADQSTKSWSPATDVNFGALKKRHGTILPITDEEYKAIKAKYSDEVPEPEQKVLADFNFDDETTGFESENAKATGNYTLKDSYNEKAGKAVYLDGSADQYLQVTDKEGKSLLTGSRSMTVSFDMKADRTSTNWAMYAAPNSTAPTYKYEKYLGILNANGETTAQRYNNNGTRPASVSANSGNDWSHIDVVYAEDSTSIYVNGEKKATEKSDYDLSTILGKNSILQIGKANWGSGEYFKGWIDNFRIENRALSEEQVTALSEDFVATLPAVKSAEVGTQPTRAEALEYRGTDDHTGIKTDVDQDAKTITSYVRKGTDLAKVPVTVSFNKKADKITVDGKEFTSGDTLDLSADRELVIEKNGSKEIWTVKKPVVCNNPVLPGQYADPDIDYMDGKFWIFPTTDGYPGWAGTKFHAFSSEDMVNWKDEGVILELANENPGKNEQGTEIAASPWAVGGSAWAPTIEEKDGKYYFYYCGKFKNGQSAIGVAVADDPKGPYTDKGTALLTVDMCKQAGVSMGQAIDPSIFTDDDGTSYITFGNGSAAIAQLNDDMMSIKEDSLKQITGLTDFRESVVVTKANGKYHWTWSCDDANSPNYHVNYGVSDSLTNADGKVSVELKKKNLLAKDEQLGILGSAHQSVLHVKDGSGKDRYFMAYHRFYTPLNIFNSGDGLGKHRETCIDEIQFDAEGYMTVTPTLEGVGAVKMKVDEPDKPSVDEKIAVISSNVKLSTTKYTYNGKVKTPKVTVKKDGKTVKATSYTVSYAAGRKNVGIYKVKVTMKGAYKGVITKTFKILPKKTTLKSVKKDGKKAIAVKWKKQKKQTTGYQIQYAVNKKFTKNAKVTTVKSNKLTAKTIKKLKKGKTYYVRIRTYKNVKVKGKTTKYVSTWSKAKKVKVK